MTEYFEVLDRDGPARRGELRLTEPRATPGLVGDTLADAGSLWAADRTVPEGDPAKLTVLPHRAFPAGTPADLQSAMDVPAPEIDGPSAAVVSPETVADLGTDAYVLSAPGQLVGHARALVETLLDVRRTIPDDAALVVSGIATPANVGLLAYAGVDLVDDHRAVLAGTEGRYLDSTGETFLEDRAELGCACPACQGPRAEFTRADCVDHNVAALRAELRRVRERIRAGTLREYLEGQVRHEPWLTAALRRLDQEGTYLRERTPLFRGSELLATTEDSLFRPAVAQFADRVAERYTNRFSDVPLLLVPCSAGKPYSDSKSHRRFQEAARYRAHKVSLTSPLGVVPQELELTYPAQHYDAAVTGSWSETEIQVVADRLRTYLERTDYPRIVAHVPEDGYREIVERATSGMDLPVTDTVSGHPTDGDSLSALGEALEGERTIRVEEKERATLRAIADYQFGAGAGEELFDELTLQGRYPRLQALDSDGDQLAALVPQYGTLALTLAGAHAWAESSIETKHVEIDAFQPHGSILAPGIRTAESSIQVGEEVLFEGPQAFGIGRATMHGTAMERSTRGEAVDVRHTEPID
ncbi:archaeosine synthase subunit alpha [Halodesulfurarchaeum formicicum]|uniref:Archaeosine synthase n=1 Tax=Halodesulfurarchaeum formicicum TaxID=1873524 RepID=A0A1J1AF82_9EURY|nr:archaeosine synthase subunit alpha [Halodesulfurarchaeum formicicum]APE96459.1 archaeosine synthase [Halodesulfurarchaeum formicicum]